MTEGEGGPHMRVDAGEADRFLLEGVEDTDKERVTVRGVDMTKTLETRTQNLDTKTADIANTLSH